LAGELSRRCGCHVGFDALAIRVEGAQEQAAVAAIVRELGTQDPSSFTATVDEAALDGLKFSQCLPRERGLATLTSRLRDVVALRTVLSQPLRMVSGL
jgi:ATP-dependent Lhr-like helicase